MRVRQDRHTAHVAEWIAWQGARLTQNRLEVERFLRALDPEAERFSFRTFSETAYTRLPGWDPLERSIHGELSACWDELVQLNHKGAAVCVTINRTNGRGRSVSDILQVRALFLDDDEPPEQVDRFPLTPQIQIESSPGRYHHYWLVHDLPLNRFHEIQRQLALQFGADQRVAVLNQAMQIPGIWRRKNLLRPLLPVIRKVNPIPPYSQDEIGALLVYATT